MALDIIKSSPGKLYLHVANLMRGRIRSGEWVPGDKLPRIVDLAEEYEVANVTVRQACAILEQEGLIRRYQGKGTFVSEPPTRQPSFHLTSDWMSLIRMLRESKPELKNVTNSVAEPVLQPGEGTPAPAYRYIKKVHTCDGIPCAVVSIYLDTRCYDQAPEQFQTDLVIPVLESLPEVTVETGRQILTIGYANVETAELLNIPLNTPVGEVRRVLLDDSGCAVYVGEVTYRGDFVKLEIDLRRGETTTESRPSAEDSPPLVKKS